MNGNSTYYTGLITRYLSRETTEDELLLLSDWLKSDPQNEELFRQYLKTWQLIENQKINSSVNLDQEWKTMQKKMTASEKGYETQPQRISLNPIRGAKENAFQKTWKIAAAVTILLAASFVLYFNLTKIREVEVTAQSTNIVRVLPDGTIVSLHAGSQIKYPATYDSKIRKVELKGEGYFEVAHDNTKPFIVSSGDARVEVLGTKFNVNTQTASGTMEVILSSGRVSVYFDEKSNQNVLLNPGEKAILLTEKEQISKSANTDPNYMAWKTRVLVFENETLSEVVNTLQNVYQTPVTLSDPALSGCRVTATFNHQSLESVLHVIKETLDVQVKQNGTIIEISGNGCK